MKDWPVDEAEIRFGEMLSECLKHGPQVVTRQGVEAAVLVPASEWRRLHPTPTRTLKEWLLTDEARHDFDLPDRKSVRSRPPPDSNKPVLAKHERRLGASPASLLNPFESLP